MRRWLVLLALLALAPVAQAAEPAEVARIAGYQGADRQTMLEAGARREGELVIYCVGAQIDPVLKAFQEKYPFLALRAVKQEVPQIVKRVIEEYRAGVHAVDAYELDDYGLTPLREAGHLAAFRSPEMAAYDADAIEAGRHWVLMRQDFVSLAFNTNSIAPEAAPRRHQDLLDPKWTGKMGISASGSAATMWVGALAVSEGEPFLQRLARQNLTFYNLGGRAVANLVVSGEAPLIVNGRRSHMFASRKEGAAVEWRAIGPSYTSVSGGALAARAKNPHAGMLFVDFLLSASAQQIYTSDLGYASLRRDMAAADAPAEKLYLTLRPDFYRDYEGWSDLTDGLFRVRR